MPPRPRADSMSKDQLVRFYDRMMNQRGVVSEERIKTLEESLDRVTRELQEAQRRLVLAERQGSANAGAPVYARPPDCIHYADGPRYKGGFGVPSESTPGKTYVVSFDIAVGYWVCSCPAGINRGLCHHLKDHDRPGKAKGKQATPQFVAPQGTAAPMPPLPASMRRPLRQFARPGEEV